MQNFVSSIDRACAHTGMKYITMRQIYTCMYSLWTDIHVHTRHKRLYITSRSIVGGARGWEKVMLVIGEGLNACLDF